MARKQWEAPHVVHARMGCRDRKALLLIGILSVGAALLVGGCSGIATRHEESARRDIKETKSRYRPQDAKPPLPTLTENSALPDLIHYAFLNSPRVEAAFYDWAASVEEITTARSLPDPMLNFGATISQGIPSLSAALMTDPGMNWPGPGKLPLKAEAAYAEAQMKRALFEDELLASALAVKRAYYEMWVLQEQVRWTREVLAFSSETEALARGRLAVSRTTQADVLRAQMEQDRLRNRLADLQDARGPLETRLRTALGLAPGSPLPKFAARLQESPADFTEQSLMETAFVRNPRLKAMHGEVLQAVALYELARKNTVPDYSFGVGVSGDGMSPVAVMPSFGITLPIWRDKIAAEIARGSSRTDAARSRLSAEELELAVRFAETAYAWREADRAAGLYGRNLIPKAQSSLDSARAGYVGGLSNFSDLLDAERMLLEYHLSHAEAVGRREIVLAEMSLVVLGRWPEKVGTLLPENVAGTAGGGKSVKKGDAP